LSDDFESITKVLSSGIFAAYLLGYDLANEENKPKLEAISKKTKFSKTSNFADGDPIDLNFDIPPEDAIEYFKRKEIVTKPTFNKLEREAKAAAFTVGGIYREDVLSAFKDEITSALENGTSGKVVVKNFKQILSDGGHKELGDWHLENVCRTNMMMAYGVGRRTAMEEVKDLLPIWEYSAVGDDRTRPRHLALDGIQYPANHAFWDTYYGPWEFACRCSVIALPDYRDGYNPRKPNADSRIDYDNDGLPTKVENGTQVLDMKVSNFVGVPKIASLEKVLTNAANAAKDSRLLNHRNLPQVIVDAAREIRLSKKENLIGWDKDGNQVGRFVGNVDEVGYPIRIEPKMKDGFDIHNHPREKGVYFESFSEQDLNAIIQLDLKASYVVSQNYLYQIRRPKNGWDENSIDEIFSFYKKHSKMIMDKLTGRYKIGELKFEELEDLARHLTWKEVAAELKLKYKRFKVSEL
jgi:SPP1 gp7 family putative phage head morphogenesis protein